MTDKVNPRHYQTKNGLEAIHVIEAFGLDFLTGNAMKYILRAGKKANEPEADDIRKAIWYLDRRLMQLEEGRAA